MVARKTRRKPPKPTTAQQRKSVLARSARENARPRAETATVSDDCCSTQGISWMDQPTPCRHDCHFSDHAFRREAEERGPRRPLAEVGDEETPVRRDQVQLETACGHCGKVFPTPTAGAEHAASHRPERLQPSEDHGWPEAYVDGQSWGDYAAGKKPRRKMKEAA